MELIDTHCHIHSADYPLDADEAIAVAKVAGVGRLVCVGTDLEDSRRAVEFVRDREKCWATIGLHPHEAARYVGDETAQKAFAGLVARPKVVAVGECGLDYYYNHSPKADQAKLLRFQLELAITHNLPLVFHIREAFADFWPIFDEYTAVRGVVHSFSAGQQELDQILARNLYVGLNGIMTFTKDKWQLAAAKNIPLQKLLLETDAPYLTPVPYRGTICQPEHVRVTAEFLSDLRDESLDDLAAATTHSAAHLFRLSS